MKRKFRILLLGMGNNIINIHVRDNYFIPLVRLTNKDFIFIDKSGSEIDSSIVIDYVNGEYYIEVNTLLLDKVRIKKHGYSTRFIKLKR